MAVQPMPGLPRPFRRPPSITAALPSTAAARRAASADCGAVLAIVSTAMEGLPRRQRDRPMPVAYAKERRLHQVGIPHCAGTQPKRRAGTPHELRGGAGIMVESVSMALLGQGEPSSWSSQGL